MKPVLDEALHAYINEGQRSVGTELYVSIMYETTAVSETAERMPDRSPAKLEFARIWPAAGKIVYLRTLGDAGRKAGS